MATVDPGERPLSTDPVTASRVATVVENVGAAERRNHTDEEQTTAQVAAGGSTVGALAGIAAVVLAILGLVDVAVDYMLPIAVIAVAVAFLSEGAALAACQGRGSVGSGMNAAFLAGVAGVVLGVLALLGMVPVTLSASAVLVFGGAMLLGAGEGCRRAYSAAGHDSDAADETMGVAGAKILVGVAALVLGIFALRGTLPVTLTLVALLALGATLMLSGIAIGSRMFNALRY